MNYEIIGELWNMFNVNVLYVSLQNKARNKCYVLIYEKLINSRDNIYWVPDV